MPGLRNLCSPGKSIEMRSRLPTIVSSVSTKRWPLSSTALLSSNSPVRMPGPLVSHMMASGTPTSRAAWRAAAMN